MGQFRKPLPGSVKLGVLSVKDSSIKGAGQAIPGAYRLTGPMSRFPNICWLNNVGVDCNQDNCLPQNTYSVISSYLGKRSVEVTLVVNPHTKISN